MVRPKKYGEDKPHNVHMRLTDEAYVWLERLADDLHISKADVIERLARGDLKIVPMGHTD